MKRDSTGPHTRDLPHQHGTAEPALAGTWKAASQKIIVGGDMSVQLVEIMGRRTDVSVSRKHQTGGGNQSIGISRAVICSAIAHEISCNSIIKVCAAAKFTDKPAQSDQEYKRL